MNAHSAISSYTPLVDVDWVAVPTTRPGRIDRIRDALRDFAVRRNERRLDRALSGAAGGARDSVLAGHPTATFRAA